MSYTCPYLKEEGYGRYYCELKEDYVNEDKYKNFCYAVHSARYWKCPAYEREDHERELYGRPRLKR